MSPTLLCCARGALGGNVADHSDETFDGPGTDNRQLVAGDEMDAESHQVADAHAGLGRQLVKQCPLRRRELQFKARALFHGGENTVWSPVFHRTKLQARADHGSWVVIWGGPWPERLTHQRPRQKSGRGHPWGSFPQQGCESWGLVAKHCGIMRDKRYLSCA